MRIKIRRQRWFGLACGCLSLTSLSFYAAEPARLGDLRGVWQAHFNSDASRLLVRMRSGEVGLWDARKATRITVDPALKKPSNAYVISPDLRKFLVGFKDGQSRVFDASSGSAVSPGLDLSLRENVNPGAVFSPDGGTIVFLGEKEAAVFDAKTGKRIARLPIAFERGEDFPDATASAIFASGGAKCFVLDPQGTVTTYETKTWTPLGKPMSHPGAEMAYEFGFEASVDGKWIVTFDGPGENGPTGQLQAWDALTNKPLGEPLSAVNGLSGRFLPGQNRVLVQGGRGEASVRDLPSMGISYVIKQHDEIDGPKVDVFPNGKWLIVWGPDKKVDLIDAVSGDVLKSHSPASPIAGSMIPLDSSSCYLEIDHSLFLDKTYWETYLLRLSVPEWETKGSIRIVDYVHRRSLSSDGRWIMIVQGTSDHERVVIYDATTMKPIDWSKP